MFNLWNFTNCAFDFKKLCCTEYTGILIFRLCCSYFCVLVYVKTPKIVAKDRTVTQVFCCQMSVVGSGKCFQTIKVFDVLLTVHLSTFISVINQLDAHNFCFTISLFHASTCFEHMCSSSGGQNCITQLLISSHLQVAVSCTRRPPVGVMIPEAV